MNASNIVWASTRSGRKIDTTFRRGEKAVSRTKTSHAIISQSVVCHENTGGKNKYGTKPNEITSCYDERLGVHMS